MLKLWEIGNMKNPAEFKLNDSEFFGDGDWDDKKRELMQTFADYASQQDPRWQFQVDRVYIGDKSHNPPNRDKYNITRIR